MKQQPPQGKSFPNAGYDSVLCKSNTLPAAMQQTQNNCQKYDSKNLVQKVFSKNRLVCPYDEILYQSGSSAYGKQNGTTQYGPLLYALFHRFSFNECRLPNFSEKARLSSYVYQVCHSMIGFGFNQSKLDLTCFMLKKPNPRA